MGSPAWLPSPATSLIGRDHECATAATLLARSRMLTLTGPGGVGKTRVAIALAASLQAIFADGVVFVPLAHIADAQAVLPAVAQALGLHEQGDQAIREALAEQLRTSAMLLVIDNFEQVSAAAPQIAALLSDTQQLKLLITSRAALQVSGEQEYPLQPLTLPAAEDAEQIADSPAVQLFVERARAIRPGFGLDADNAGAVAAICRRVDGLPLAIELAASHTRLLSPRALLARLDQRLSLLTGGAHDLPARHKTMRSAIAWSYDLLTADEQLLLRRLTVFVGSWDIEAAQAVCGAGGAEQPDLLVGLDALLVKSLIWRSDMAGEPRFAMLETIREFAAERLAESGELPALRQRHAAYFLALAEQAEPHLTGLNQQAWLARLATEQDNTRAALGWLLGAGDPAPADGALDAGLRLAGALWRFWWMRGQLREGRSWLDLAIERSNEGLPIAELRSPTFDPAAREQLRTGLALRARVLTGSGALARGQANSPAAAAFFEAALALYEELGDQRGVAVALNGLGNVAYDQSHYAAARTRFTASLQLHRQLGNTWSCALLINNLASAHYAQGTYDQALPLHQESLSLMRSLNSPRGIATALGGIGQVMLQQGDYAAAQVHLQESLAAYRASEDRRGIGKALHSLGQAALAVSDYEAARSWLEQSLSIRNDVGDSSETCQTLGALGDLARAAGDTAAAHEHYTASLRILRQLGPSPAVSEALDGLAGLAVLGGQAERAATLSGAAEAIRAHLDIPRPPIARARHEQDQAALRRALSATARAEAALRGQTLPLEEIVALALQPLAEAPANAPPAVRPAARAPDAHNSTADELTARELDVLRLVAAGLSNPAIAERLVLSIYTIQAHLRSIYNKLGVTSRSAATRYAWEHRMILEVPPVVAGQDRRLKSS